MAQRAITRRILDVARRFQQALRPERWVVFHNDGGRLFFGEDPDDQPTTEDELERIQDEPAFVTHLIEVVYTDEAQVPA